MQEVIESLGRIRLQGITLLAVAFLVGGVVGVVFEKIRSEPGGRPVFGRMADLHGRLGELPPFLDELGLSEQQEARIREILEKRRPMTDSILQQTMPHLRAILDSTRNDIRKLLTPEQCVRLDRQLPRRDEAGQSWPPPGPGDTSGHPPRPPFGGPR